MILILGSILGVILITALTSDVIKIYYGALLLMISSYLFYGEDKIYINKSKSHRYINTFSLFTGTISTMLGIGGGTITTFEQEDCGETELQSAVLRCLDCLNADICKTWLARAEKGSAAPSFCANAARFNRLRQGRENVTF